MYKEFIKFTDDQSDVNDMDFNCSGVCSVDSRPTMICNMQHASGDYSTHQVTEAVGDMTLGGHTRSGVDPQCQEPDDDTRISKSNFPSHPPNIIGSCTDHTIGKCNNVYEPTDIGMEGKTSVESSNLTSIIKVEKNR